MSKRTACLLLFLGIAPVLAAEPDPKDPSTWTPIEITGRQPAPAFADITAWINSPPLKMSDLKGKVVVVHFLAFGWINCTRNYPWYKEITKKYRGKNVVVIGIHTPETDAEKNVESVKTKMKKADLTHPIVIDNKATMWQRYSNRYWPSIYLIDKQGIARWGWSGELSWKGAKGETHMREKIDKLLRE